MSRCPARRPFSSSFVVPVLLAGLLSPGAIAQTATPSDPPPVLTLQDCVRLALDSSAGLRTREIERQIAGDDVTEAWGAFLPNLSLSGSYTKSDRTDFDVASSIYGVREVGFPTEGGDTVYIPYDAVIGSRTGDVNVKATSKNWGLSANLNLFDGLANINRLQAARARREAADLSANYTRELVIQNVAVAYFELLRYLQLKDVAAETRDQAAAELQRTETYFRLGSAAKSDVLQQRVRLEQTRYDLVVAENRVEKAVADLAYAMNQPLTKRLTIDPSPLETALTAEGMSLLVDQPLDDRLDLRSSAATQQAAERAAAAAGGAFFPRLDVYSRYSRAYDESPYRFGSQESESWVWGAQLSWDIFNGFQNSTARSRARAQARIAAYQHEQAHLDAQLEVRQYDIAIREAIERHQLALERITHTEEELRLAQERFRVGAGTQLERITAEVNLAGARADKVQAICDFLIARVLLSRATGQAQAQELNWR
ncbi:MAG: TolC family protein [Candidatus Krumholzibacteria bacterium]|jgi:outer membrane protein TolC|nr:TolC family protein [Candidatus Krumholzibacteria bacterium]